MTETENSTSVDDLFRQGLTCVIQTDRKRIRSTQDSILIILTDSVENSPKSVRTTLRQPRSKTMLNEIDGKVFKFNAKNSSAEMVLSSFISRLII